MPHWSEKYVGLPHTAKRDCVWLVRHVIKKECGFRIKFPQLSSWIHPNDTALKEVTATIADEVSAPQDFDGCLMRHVGRQRSFGSHVGVVAMVNGACWVLHSLEHIGVVFCPVTLLPTHWLSLSGYYRWRR